VVGAGLSVAVGVLVGDAVVLGDAVVVGDVLGVGDGSGVAVALGVIVAVAVGVTTSAIAIGGSRAMAEPAATRAAPAMRPDLRRGGVLNRDAVFDIRLFSFSLSTAP
jgi:UDP-3-O-[3-hydroxymyristoyl] glucosamine N-acyltransferase